MIKGVTHAHLGTIWYHSEPSDVPYSPNQFLALDFFCRFLQQDGSSRFVQEPTYMLSDWSRETSQLRCHFMADNFLSIWACLILCTKKRYVNQRSFFPSSLDQIKLWKDLVSPMRIEDKKTTHLTSSLTFLIHLTRRIKNSVS